MPAPPLSPWTASHAGIQRCILFSSHIAHCCWIVCNMTHFKMCWEERVFNFHTSCKKSLMHSTIYPDLSFWSVHCFALVAFCNVGLPSMSSIIGFKIDCPLSLPLSKFPNPKSFPCSYPICSISRLLLVPHRPAWISNIPLDLLSTLGGGLYLAALVLCSTPETSNEPLVPVPGCGASK